MRALLQKLYFVSHPSVWLSFDLLKGYTSPEGSASCYTPLTDSNIKTTGQLWVFIQAFALLHLWDLSQVTSLAYVWCGSDAMSCGSAYVVMRSIHGDISMGDLLDSVSLSFVLWVCLRCALHMFQATKTKMSLSLVLFLCLCWSRPALSQSSCAANLVCPR